MRSITLALAASLLAAFPAAAQHCWPTSIALMVRDERGTVIDPSPLMDSLRYSPARRETADFLVRVVRIHPASTNDFDRPGGIPMITWYGQGDCRVDMREVVLRRGGAAMRLWMDLHLDAERHPGAGDFILKAPPFAAGTWRLDVCALPHPATDGYAIIPPRWVRVSASADPAAAWQPPRCGAAG